ncbi:hydantoinase/oxoprolinase family protein [Rhizobium puerariae]|uniref:Hydantoinase/oxoprolinase family protein n=1 Tax=Rhizobium puerariae TaxID=1585791 RepID=A0ABV6AJF8_9HYPH
MSMTSYRPRLAVDIGGTFTDIVLETAPEQFLSGKYLTTHAAPEQAVLSGVRDLLAQARVAPADIGHVVHGTTLATNALIERTGAKTALVTTKGFRDSLEIAFEHRFDVSDINMERPLPLVPRNLRLEVDERIVADGSVLRELDEASVRALVPIVRAEAIEAVAVCLLHSYANPAHEIRVSDILAEALPDIPVTLSSTICPEIREYERATTTVANAFVQPIMESYLKRLAQQFRDLGITAPVMLMTSAGGLTSLERACVEPIKLVESGPAGGAVLAAHIARMLEIDAAIAFDMGGTTAKLVLIDNGEPHHSRHLEVARAYRYLRGSGLPMRVPVIDLVEIGAGGGSLGAVDTLGLVTVGPRSAGSEPGPASYGRGGTQPAVTDADLLLGRIDPQSFAGGKIMPNVQLAEAALTRAIAEPLGIDARAAALAMLEVVDENMANAGRVHATDNGVEPDGRTLIAFGGAAPMHAARIARKLGIDRVVVPFGAGVGSAHGFLIAPVACELARTRLLPLKDFDIGAMQQLFADLSAEAHVILGDTEIVQQQRTVYARYRGQGHEVQIPLPDTTYADIPERIRTAFEDEYHRHFGRIIPGMDIECVTWTLAAGGQTSASRPLPAKADTPLAAPPPRRYQSLADPVTLEDAPAAIHLRDDLPVDTIINGPAVIAEAETNTVVPAGFTARILPGRHILLTSEVK